MNEHLYRWRNRQLREHVAVVDGHLAPTKILKQATYLNVFLKKWMTANIWIYEDRIVYVGEELPEKMSPKTEVINCKGRYLVPGYIEPHSHPFQLYNPHSLAEYALKTGTSTLVNDNLMWLLLLDDKKAFSLLDELQNMPVSLFWWARFSSQSELREEVEFLDDEDVLKWLNHEAVIQGGELTNWPDILREDERGLYWMQETKRLRKVVEGHFPGASKKTLTKMKLLGADGDHESISGEELYRRLELGYYAAIRQSSIRPDLRKVLQDLNELELNVWDYVLYTTDGSTPSFYDKGIINECIQIAIEEGVPLEDAYSMATINPAKYFSLDNRLGSIAPGRVAHINFLHSKEDPTPASVLAKGEWIVKDHEYVGQPYEMDWEKFQLTKMEIDWELDPDELRFSMPVGMEMVNDVIMKPYPIRSEADKNVLARSEDEAYVMLIDRDGEWRVSTYLKGFTKRLGGLVSSYSNTGDIILVGKSKRDMKLAFDRMKEIGGGIVIAHAGEVIFELPLPIRGVMTNIPMEELIEKERELKKLLQDFGYSHSDPVYTLLFLSSTHLPYIRITPVGIMDVIKKEILFPAIMR
ncbi:adenine deaminase C-terminal domain-containing protein [Tenuibacillus multivorans]|uniref:adenine deaminase n=1 Tax=Tenuibacillus multivorans TaxID=237069 RepID=A0A1H0E1M6_9BACI|nr:adenine deaminase C-terminal domain-containing protein [Tenuibacillus multivorans]GEL76685.1 putative adenine deaminase [Tenuibacillus multivorans]SDN76417.1 adenine deaminase [Tenuibacillus multivorans]